MLAKHIVEKYGYKWDDNWEDTNNVDLVLETMKSFDEDSKKVVLDIAHYFIGKADTNLIVHS